MDSLPHPSRLAAWVRAIGVLAASAEHQQAWLDSLGPVASWNVSELGLEFEDGYLLMGQWVEAGWIASVSVPAFHALNAALDHMSGQSNESLWTREALSNHRAWREVRALAMNALSTIA